MAYDGLAVSATVRELKCILGGRLYKLTQPERDELILIIKNGKETLRLKLSAQASCPMVRLTDEQKLSPKTAPSFLMSLRKHIGNGIITDIFQPDTSLSSQGLERIIIFKIEHRDEMGDLGIVLLSAELMGKYSNIILLKEDLTIIDSIKHVSLSQSSVREILPGRKYFIPSQEGKQNPLEIDKSSFRDILSAFENDERKTLLSFTGLSSRSIEEIIFRASLMDGEDRLFYSLKNLINTVSNGEEAPEIIYKDSVPLDFTPFTLTGYRKDQSSSFSFRSFSSVSEAIGFFFLEKDRSSRLRERSQDLNGRISVLLDRAGRKYILQESQIKKCFDRDKYRIYGELLHTYGYSLKGGEESLTCENFYTGEEISIPLNPSLSAMENAQKYLDRYSKLKRTEENTIPQLEKTRLEILHLESIKSSIGLSENEDDLNDIRREMQDFGYIKNTAKSHREKEKKSKPLETDIMGFKTYIGRNNYQNEEVTFRIADGQDLWFHLKGSPGSHVIVKTEGKSLEELPDELFVRAASLAAFYSSMRNSKRAEVDYTFKKNLKRVPHQAPGFVIYHQNYSINVSPEGL